MIILMMIAMEIATMIAKKMAMRRAIRTCESVPGFRKTTMEVKHNFLLISRFQKSSPQNKFFEPTTEDYQKPDM